MIDFEGHLKRKVEQHSTQQRAKDLLHDVVGDRHMASFEGGFRATLPQTGESPASYIVRALSNTGTEVNTYQRERVGYRAGVHISNRRVASVPMHEMALVSAITYKAGEQVVGYGLTLEGMAGAKTVVVRKEGSAQALDKPLTHIEAVHAGQRLFPGQTITNVEAVVGGLLPSDGSPHGGQPLPVEKIA